MLVDYSTQPRPDLLTRLERLYSQPRPQTVTFADQLRSIVASYQPSNVKIIEMPRYYMRAS